MRRHPWLLFLLACAVVQGVALPAPAGAENGRWRGPDGRFLPFETDEEMLAFLRNAEVIEKKELSQGINRPTKVRLRRGDVEAHAVFRTVNDRKARHRAGGEVFVDFHDNYLFECAAYEMDRLLAIDRVPPCVVRDLGSRRGTLQLWVENAMTEEKRRKKGAGAPSPMRWVRQKQLMWLFDALIYNFDRNQGNMLIDEDWKLWFIDHTRSFALSTHIEKMERILWCEREVWERFRALDKATVDEHLGELVEAKRREALMMRHKMLLEYLEQLIAERGEDVVLYDGGS